MSRRLSVGVAFDRFVEGPNAQVRDELVPTPPESNLVTDLDEICEWLGTFRERLRRASPEDQAELTSRVRQWSDRLQQRRAELA